MINNLKLRIGTCFTPKEGAPSKLSTINHNEVLIENANEVIKGK